jgi:acyl-[acyl-carrier-protein]-phospholipid O-acyltransferase/long-chain-fatty-acid--[acyl-carrier-protein] ligase
VTVASGQDIAVQIRQARGKFAAMAASYFLGVFNDNYFKQAACLMAVGAGFSDLQGYLAAVFTRPFLLLAAPAGWMADRFCKRRIVIAAKLMELAAFGVGAIGICYQLWYLVLVMVFIMGSQATIFSPALNGSIPELYPASYVVKANAMMKVLTTAAILIGVWTAGESLDLDGYAWGGITLGQLTVAGVTLTVALVGTLVSLGVPRRPAAHPTAKFPWSGPVDTVKALYRTRHDPLLAVTIGIDAFVWFVAAMQILLINEMGIQEFGFDKAGTARLVFAELVGVAIGGPLAGRLAHGERWYRVLAPAGVTMGAFMLAMPAVPLLPNQWQFYGLLALLLGVGIPGGLLLVPLESFIQVRPAAHEKGTVIAAGNFAAFAGILLAGIVSVPTTAMLDGTTSLAILGGLSTAASVGVGVIFSKGRWR